MGKKKVAETKTAEAPRLDSAKMVGKQAGGEKAPSAAKKTRKFEHGRVYVNASYNNTVITLTDTAGNVVAWASAGSLGFSGPKKATPFASSKVVSAITEKVKPLGVATLDVFVKGVGGGRDSAIRSFINQGFNVVSIKDVTPIPHNGPRPRKVRRV